MSETIRQLQKALREMADTMNELVKENSRLRRQAVVSLEWLEDFCEKNTHDEDFMIFPRDLLSAAKKEARK